MRRWFTIAVVTVGACVIATVVCVVAMLAWFAHLDRANATVVSGGVEREYLLYVPKSYDARIPTALVISLHGAAGWPAQQQNLSHWNDLAEKYGFIVAYPAGMSLRGENAHGPRVWPMSPRATAANVKYIDDAIEKIASTYNIDRGRIYANGLSNGGAMVFALSCRSAHRLAAVAEVAAARELPATWCGDGHAVPVIAFHGTADPIVPYHGGLSKDKFHPVVFPDVRQWSAAWAERNGCSAEPQEQRVSARVVRTSYTQCAHDAEVELYTVSGGGHAWPGGKPLPRWWVGETTNEIDATEVIWKFFERHPLAR